MRTKLNIYEPHTTYLYIILVYLQIYGDFNQLYMLHMYFEFKCCELYHHLNHNITLSLFTKSSGDQIPYLVLYNK